MHADISCPAHPGSAGLTASVRPTRITWIAAVGSAVLAGGAALAGAVVAFGPLPLTWPHVLDGPARLAVKGRRAIAPFLREQPEWTFGIVSFIMLLIFIWGPIPATHKPAGIIVFLALALFGTEVLRRQTALEFPDG